MRGFPAVLLTTFLLAIGAGSVALDQQSQSIARSSPGTVDLLDSRLSFDVPDDPREAAAMLVDKALDGKSGVAGVREILTRAGVRIIDASGTTLNSPAVPIKLGIHVYDFQVAALAVSLQDNQTVSLSKVAELAPLVVGVELPDDVLEEAVDAWMESAPDDPSNPEAFDAAVVAELLSRTNAAEPAGKRLVLISYLLLSADLYGGKGIPRDRAESAAWFKVFQPMARAVAASPCPSEEYDAAEGSLFEGARKFLEWAIDHAKGRPDLSPSWKSKLGKFESAYGLADDAKDVVDLLDSMLARAALVAALSIRVENDASASTPHRRHASGYPQYLNFRATVRFETKYPGVTVMCGPLEGYTIPDNSPVNGVWVRWEITGDGIQTADSSSSDALSRGGGGGGFTNSEGIAKLKTETTFERGCPNDDNICGKGELKKKDSRVRAWLDLTRTPPVKIQDLLMGPNPWKDAGKATLQVLMDVVTDIATSAKGSSSKVSIEYHARPDYILSFEGTVEIDGSCGTGNFQAQGTMKTVLELRAEDGSNGSFRANGVLDPSGQWSYSQTGQTCRITPKQPAVSAELKDDGRLLIKLDDLHSDSWICLPGAAGNAWWWMHYQLVMLDYRADDQPVGGWLELTPNPPKYKSGPRERTFKVIDQALDCQTTTATTKIKLETGG